MGHFTLEIYFENGDDELATDASAALKALVAHLAPHLALEVIVRKAHSIRCCDLGGVGREVPCHDPSSSDNQSALITSQDIGTSGWGWPGSCVVSKRALFKKQEH